MRIDKQTIIACLRRAALAATGAALCAVALHATASAQVGPASATAPSAAALPPPTCNAPSELTRLARPLLHTMARLASGRPLTIVAIGSSSTAGAGASSAAATYPARLAVELRALLRGQEVVVLNRGVNGQVTDQMMARFSTDVIAAYPQLVLWQVGTNSVLRDQPLRPHGAELHQGIDDLKAAGADVILIDPQYAPKVLAKSEAPGMIEQIALAAKEEDVDLFRRFAIMQYWHDAAHVSFDAFLSPDKLHMNDWSYGCWAKLFAGAIAEAATRPIASAAARPPSR